MSDRAVTDLAAAVADGDTIDWPAATSRLTSSVDHSIAEELKTLSELGSMRRSAPVELTSRRLPWVLEAARLVAIGCCALGGAGLANALRGADSGRFTVLFAVLVTFAGTAILLDVGGRDRRTRALAACYWTIAASFAARGIFELAGESPGVVALALVLSFRPEALFPAILWQFAREFPVLTRFSRVDRVCTGAIHLATILGVALFLVNMLPVLAPASRIHEATNALQRLDGYGPWFWNLVFGAALPALVVMAWRARLAAGQESARVRLFLSGVALSITPVILEVIAEGLFPSFARIMQTPAGRWWGAWFVYPPMFLLPAATAYAVAVDHVLEVRVVIQRALRYLLARWLIMWGAAMPIAMLLIHLHGRADQPLADVLATPRARILVGATIAAAVLLSCRRTLLRVLDRWALPGLENPAAVLTQMSDRLKATRTPLEVATVVARAIERALQSAADAYVIRDGALIPVRGDTPPPPRVSIIPVLLEASREPCVVAVRERHSYYNLMTEDDRRWIADGQISLLVPIASGRSGGGLLGVVALKDRRNALSYTADDVRFLRAVTAAATLACDVVRSEDKVRAGVSTAAAEEMARECTRCGQVKAWDSAGSVCDCGGTWQPAALPKVLGSRFEVRQRLGSGGMGVVYRATDLILGRDAAVKTLTRLSDVAATRLLTEAKTMAGLSHAHVAVLYETAIWRGTPMLMMELMAGGTLADRLRHGPLPCAEAIDIVRRLAMALVQLRQSELYHGDVKPSNIGFTVDKVPKFLDFGLARAIQPLADVTTDGSTPELGGHVAGTIAYMSPEVRDNRVAPGPALDLWALSVVLCETATGRHPFLRARTEAEISAGLADALHGLPTEDAERLRPFLSRALSYDPGRRPRSAAEMVEALADLDRS